VDGTCGTHGVEERRGVYRVSVGMPEGKRPLGRPRRRWEDNIKMELREIVIDGGTGFGWLKGGSSGGFCEKGNEPLGFIKKEGCCLTSCVTISFSNNILHHEVSK
jgi:hypothetical protein